MTKRIWKKFDALVEKCYLNMVGANKNGSCWEESFALFKEIVAQGRAENPNYAKTLEDIDDSTDYVHDIQMWLEDCLEEIEMREEYELLISMCDDLLDMFSWEEGSGTDIKFQRIFALRGLKRYSEALECCKVWMKEEPRSVYANVAGAYVYMEQKEFDKAEKLLIPFIKDKICVEENEIAFAAALALYTIVGNSEKQKEMEQILRDYDEYLQQFYEGWNDEVDDVDDEELPF